MSRAISPTPNDDTQALDGPLTFMRSVWALAHALDKRSKWMGTHLGLTGPQRLAIRAIGRSPGMSPGRLAKLLHLHPSTVTGVVQRLEERGLVARGRDATDSRRAMLVLTPAGHAHEAPTEGTVESCIADVLATMPAEDIARVESLLLTLASALEKDLD